MRLEWIEDILAVLEAGSFTAAAERRHLTASAFTRRIRSIEAALGGDLFDRSRKPVTLLPHVRNLEVELREAVRRLKDLQVALTDSQGRRARRLTLGCQHALSTMVSPKLARRLGHGRETELRVRSGTRSDCHLMLLRQEVDLGLIYETPEDALQFDSALFDKITVGQDALIPVANLRDSADLRAAMAERDLPLITYPADIYLGRVLRMHVLPGLERDISTYSAAETGLTPAVLQFVRQGLGIGWLPRAMAHESLGCGELTDLSDRLPMAILTVRAVRARSGGGDLVQAAWDRIRQDAGTLVVEGITPVSAR